MNRTARSVYAKYMIEIMKAESKTQDERVYLLAWGTLTTNTVQTKKWSVSSTDNDYTPTENRNNKVMAGVEESVREPIDNINIEQCIDLGEEALLQLNDGGVDKDWSTGYNEEHDYCWITKILLLILLKWPQFNMKNIILQT